MAVLSKLQLLGASIPAKQYAPGMLGMLSVFALIKLYKHEFRTSKNAPKRSKKPGEKSHKAHVDLVFFRKLQRILKILIPGFFSKETFYLVLIAVSLLCRTYADVYMIITSTKIEASIIDRNPLLFALEAFKYVLNLPAISVTNALLKFGIAELKLRFRERLSAHLYSQYLKGFTFYKMSNLDNRIQNADQLLTTDVDKFCDGIVELYSNLSKPILDVFLYLVRLGTSLGFSSPSILFSYLIFTGIGLTYMRRPIGRLTVEEQALEGEYRYVNSRLISNSEEIAFYQGNQSEKDTIMQTFASLVQHLRKVILFRFSVGFVDNIVAKYLATVVGWYAVGSSFFNKNHKPFIGKSRNELMQEYYNSGRMMYKMAEALGRLALAGRDMTRLSGFTSRVDTLLSVLNDVNEGNYKRTMVGGTENERDGESLVSNPKKAGSGVLNIRDNVIRFEDVPLVTPNGDTLIESLSFEVPSGRNVLVCGPNGCGKSSLFRTLGELWPLFGGTLTKPDKGKLFYVPQRPYMTMGTLRDQIIYPDRHFDMIRKGISDSDLEQMIENVQLTHILEREGGWGAVQDWMDVLSGGEKQRIAMARLFYHKPQFAILDECTSAVSVDVEGAMYRLCREMNITLFTVSHRKSLWKYHEYSLYMDGRGSYRFEQIDENSDQFGS
ncbi:unnamed protein product [Caenorhabditis angaria]|uniref:Uncharacterized protein n=1 Tax=Caenorhabditis angaria TaxID=860376 RepID=A0A9P1IAE6_9PELO|nr:unnamed protein product [Caenorhabditis angaria]